MKRMIDAEKFLDKLLYMGYMDEEKSEVEEVANNMTEEAYTKEEVIAMLTEIQLDIEKHTMTSGVTNQGIWNECIACCSRIIDGGINSLKEAKDGENNY